MKKKVAALLCGVMCVSGFTGCSDAEMASMKLGVDMLSKMSQCEVSGQMKADINLDAMKALAADVSEMVGTPVDAAELNGLSGEKTVTVDYRMQADLNRMAYDMGFDLTYEGKQYDMGNLYYSLTDGVYYSTEGLMGLYELAGDLAEDAGQDSYFLSDAYKQDWKAALGNGGYVELLNAEEMTGIDMADAMPQAGFGDMYESVLKFYQDATKGFETGLVKEIPGGYAIEADGMAAAEMLVNLLDFIADNPDQVLDATETYLLEVMNGTGVDQAARAEVQAAFAEAKNAKDDFADTLRQLSALAEAFMLDDDVKTLLEGLRYEATCRKDGDSLLSDAKYAVVHNNRNVCSITSTSVTKAATAKLTAPANAMTLDALKQKLTVLEDKYNPINGVEISWGFEDTATEALLNAARAEGSFLGLDDSNAEWTDLIVRDGRAYMPLRKICDKLGESISWDKTARTAYITVDGKRVDLAGILENGTSFVGVREFEKLGYTVDYSSVDGLKEAVIHK